MEPVITGITLPDIRESGSVRGAHAAITVAQSVMVSIENAEFELRIKRSLPIRTVRNKLQHDPSGPEKRSKPPVSGLYIVSTPIGNLGDITIRALDLLNSVDLIACEDTRVARRLLSKYHITTPLTVYHEHNAVRAGSRILRVLQKGAAVALISDAGTPLISDPGYKLVHQAQLANVSVFSVPGPNATIAALTVSGLPPDKFFFGGFLPRRQGARRKYLRELASLRASLIFFESPRRLSRCLEDVLVTLGDRPAAIARELTKHYEEVIKGSIGELAGRCIKAPPLKGELVVMVGPPDDVPGNTINEKSLNDELVNALKTMSLRDAATLVGHSNGISRHEAYRRGLKLIEK